MWVAITIAIIGYYLLNFWLNVFYGRKFMRLPKADGPSILRDWEHTVGDLIGAAFLALIPLTGPEVMFMYFWYKRFPEKPYRWKEPKPKTGLRKTIAEILARKVY